MRRYLVSSLLLALVIILGFFIYEKNNNGLTPLNPDGSSSTPVEAGRREVNVYFLNSDLDPEVTCVKVFPVKRSVEDTPRAPLKSIEALLAGPTSKEKEDNYSSAIPENVAVQSLVISGSVATVDFSEALNKVGGSCRVTAIYHEISETLKQFSPVKTVTVTVNGRSEDVLQP